MPTIDTEKIRAIAPDEGTFLRAHELTAPRRWTVLGKNERVVWGVTAGYNFSFDTCIDLENLGSKCTCPVRKLPCKHAVALMLMLDSIPKTTTQPPPDWVETWLNSRDKRKKTVQKTVDTEGGATVSTTQVKTRTERQETMLLGVADLKMRLRDYVREGLAQLQNGMQPTNEDWLNFAARLVDAKLPSLAKKVRSMSELPEKYPDDWHEKLLVALGNLYFLATVFEKIDDFEAVFQEDLNSLVGVNIKKDFVLNEKIVRDEWFVLSVTETTDTENLTTRRVWLLSKSDGRFALILDYSFGGQGFDTHFEAGTAFDAELVFYPSVVPQRALIKSLERRVAIAQLIGFPDFTHLFLAYSQQITALPWLPSMPVLLNNVVPIFADNDFCLLEKNKEGITQSIPLDAANAWRVVALASGAPIAIFGEWTGTHFIALSAFAEGRFVHF